MVAVMDEWLIPVWCIPVMWILSIIMAILLNRFVEERLRKRLRPRHRKARHGAERRRKWKSPPKMRLAYSVRQLMTDKDSQEEIELEAGAVERGNTDTLRTDTFRTDTIALAD